MQNNLKIRKPFIIVLIIVLLIPLIKIAIAQYNDYTGPDECSPIGKIADYAVGPPFVCLCHGFMHNGECIGKLKYKVGEL